MKKITRIFALALAFVMADALYRCPYFRLPNRREPKDLFPLNVTLKPVKMGV